MLAFKEAAMLMSIPRFKANNYFLHQFKRRCKITPRKITRFITRRDVTLDTVVRTRALEIVREVTDYVYANAIDADMVLNTDQSRFVYEITSNRTQQLPGKRQLKQLLQALHLLVTPTPFRSLFACQDTLQRNCTSVFRKRVVNLVNVFRKHYNVTNLQT